MMLTNLIKKALQINSIDLEHEDEFVAFTEHQLNVCCTAFDKDKRYDQASLSMVTPLDGLFLHVTGQLVRAGEGKVFIEIQINTLKLNDYLDEFNDLKAKDGNENLIHCISPDN